MRLTGKNVAITGASQGLGLAIAQRCLAEGANISICARTAADLTTAKEQLQATAGEGRVFAAMADVSSEADIESYASNSVRELGGIDALVCNAGVYGPKGAIDEADWSSWRHAIEVNLIGTVYCCRVFTPILKRSHRGKIVLLSGGGATKALPYLSAYAASKAGLVRFGETLAEELKDHAVDVNMVAPGALNTRLLDEVLMAGPERVGAAFYEASVRQKETGGTPMERGAELCAYLCSEDSDGITGKLISAVWDPWQHLQTYVSDLSGSDIYTLRRITPEDRGKRWN
ncbi:MAG: SDR family NAD(P)-dependent oxidoreductase [Bryobacteraceae bacterium]